MLRQPQVCGGGAITHGKPCPLQLCLSFVWWGRGAEGPPQSGLPEAQARPSVLGLGLASFQPLGFRVNCPYTTEAAQASRFPGPLLGLAEAALWLTACHTPVTMK